VAEVFVAGEGGGLFVDWGSDDAGGDAGVATPESVSSIAFSKYAMEARPLSALSLPQDQAEGSTLARSSTSMPLGAKEASSTRLTARMGVLRPEALTAASSTPLSPMTKGRQISSSSPSARPLTVTSGPTPEGSPMVMASRGRDAAAV
jgi:hypothetical protein